MKTVRGVRSLEINPLTGSVLIHYDLGLADGTSLIAELRDRNWIQPAVVPSSSRSAARPALSQFSPIPAVKSALAKAVLSWAAEAALERSVVALVTAIL